MYEDRLKENETIEWKSIKPAIQSIADLVVPQLREIHGDIPNFRGLATQDLSRSSSTGFVDAVIDYCCVRLNKSLPAGQLPIVDKTGTYTTNQEHITRGYYYRYNTLDKKPFLVQEQFCFAVSLFNDSDSFMEADEKVRSLNEVYHISRLLNVTEQARTALREQYIPILVEYFPRLNHLHLTLDDLIMEAAKISMIETAQRLYDILCFSVMVDDVERRFTSEVANVLNWLTTSQVIHFTTVTSVVQNGQNTEEVRRALRSIV
jgi:hypothetical protein